MTGLSSRVRRDPEVEECAEPNAVLQERDGVMMRIDLRDGTTIEDALVSRDLGTIEAAPYVGDYVTVSDD